MQRNGIVGELVREGETKLLRGRERKVFGRRKSGGRERNSHTRRKYRKHNDGNKELYTLLKTHVTTKKLSILSKGYEGSIAKEVTRFKFVMHSS